MVHPSFKEITLVSQEIQYKNYAFPIHFLCGEGSSGVPSHRKCMGKHDFKNAVAS